MCKSNVASEEMTEIMSSIFLVFCRNIFVKLSLFMEHAGGLIVVQSLATSFVGVLHDKVVHV